MSALYWERKTLRIIVPNQRTASLESLLCVLSCSVVKHKNEHFLLKLSTVRAFKTRKILVHVVSVEGACVQS